MRRAAAAVPDLLVRVLLFPFPQAKEKVRYFLRESTRHSLSLCDPHGKPPAWVRRDMRRCLFRYGICYPEYALYDLAGRTEEEKAAFIGDISRYRLYRSFNDERHLSFFSDKGRVYERFSEFYRRDVLAVRTEEDLPALTGFAEAHPRFLIKPVGKSGGEGVRILAGTADEKIAAVRAEMPVLCEEILCDHPAIAVFHPSSLNTVRIATVLSGDGVTLFYPFLRLGRGENVTDNGASGGVLVPVDEKTGFLSRVGRDEGGRFYTAHPDTGVPFGGVCLPRWEEARRLAEECARRVPEARLVSWDFAPTKDGWVLVEANLHGQFIGQQIDGKGKLPELSVLR